MAEVQQIGSEMPLNNSLSIDYISTRVLFFIFLVLFFILYFSRVIIFQKDCLPVILPALTNIINTSLMSATFPTLWKLSMLTPLLKEGDHEIPCNNCPLSLLVIVSKICEMIVLRQFNHYLFSKRWFRPHQRRNKKFHSTETLN